MSRDESRIISLEKTILAEVLASFRFSLSRCYLSTCGCTNKHVSHSSEHRGRPSNHHRPREAYVHTLTMGHHCHVARDKRSHSRSRPGAMTRQVVNSQGKNASRRLLLLDYVLSFLFSATRWRENPRRDRTREMREYYVRLYVESDDRRRRLISRSLFISLSCTCRSSTFLFHRTLINSRYARISFVDPFLARALLRDGVWAKSLFYQYLSEKKNCFGERYILIIN